jgi:hypothetical protein
MAEIVVDLHTRTVRNAHKTLVGKPQDTGLLVRRRVVLKWALQSKTVSNFS